MSDYPSNSPPKFQLNCRWLSSNKVFITHFTKQISQESEPNHVPKQKFSVFFQLDLVLTLNKFFYSDLFNFFLLK